MKVSNRYIHENLMDPSMAELAEILANKGAEMTEEKIQYAIEYENYTTDNFDKYYFNDINDELFDFEDVEENSLLVSDTIKDSTQSSDSFLISESLKIDVHTTLEKLPYREKEIIKMRFGLEGEEKSFQEISQIINVTPERARQLCDRGIRKLKGKKSILLRSYLG